MAVANVYPEPEKLSGGETVLSAPPQLRTSTVSSPVAW